MDIWRRPRVETRRRRPRRLCVCTRECSSSQVLALKIAHGARHVRVWHVFMIMIIESLFFARTHRAPTYQQTHGPHILRACTVTLYHCYDVQSSRITALAELIHRLCCHYWPWTILPPIEPLCVQTPPRPAGCPYRRELPAKIRANRWRSAALCMNFGTQPRRPRWPAWMRRPRCSLARRRDRLRRLHLPTVQI